MPGVNSAKGEDIEASKDLLEGKSDDAGNLDKETQEFKGMIYYCHNFKCNLSDFQL